MSIASRKEKEREIKRSDIIESSEKLFFQKGYENTSMDEIAINAEFTKRTLYFYFSGKDEILVEILIKAFTLFNKYLEAAYRKTHGKCGLDSINLLSTGFLDFFKDHRNYFKLMAAYETRPEDLKASEGRTKHLYTLGDIGMKYLIELIIKGKKDGSLRKNMDPVKSAVSVWLSLNGVCHLVSLKEEFLKDSYNMSGDLLIEDNIRMIEKHLSS